MDTYIIQAGANRDKTFIKYSFICESKKDYVTQNQGCSLALGLMNIGVGSGAYASFVPSFSSALEADVDVRSVLFRKFK